MNGKHPGDVFFTAVSGKKSIFIKKVQMNIREYTKIREMYNYTSRRAGRKKCIFIHNRIKMY